MEKDDDEPIIRAWEQMSYIGKTIQPLPAEWNNIIVIITAFQVWAKLNSIADGQKVFI